MKREALRAAALREGRVSRRMNICETRRPVLPSDRVRQRSVRSCVGGAHRAVEPAVDLPTGVLGLAERAVRGVGLGVAEPEGRSALTEVLERAIVRRESAARVLVDEVVDALRDRLRARLQTAGLSESLAEGLQSPWQILERTRRRQS